MARLLPRGKEGGVQRVQALLHLDGNRTLGAAHRAGRLLWTFEFL